MGNSKEARFFSQTMTNSSAKALFRALLKESYRVSDYNFRMYAIRRVKAGFLTSRDLSGAEAALAVQEGQKQWDMLRRQRTIGDLYPSSTSVME